jgi:hypothetical protein
MNSDEGVYHSELPGFPNCPSSGILKTRKHNVSETTCFRHQAKGETQLFLRDPTEYVCLPLHLRTATDPVCETLFSSLEYTMDKVRKLSNSE